MKLERKFLAYIGFNIDDKMVYGHPTQSLRLGCIPEGLRMYITDIHFSVPAGNHEWKANFRELSSTMNVSLKSTANIVIGIDLRTGNTARTEEEGTVPLRSFTGYR